MREREGERERDVLRACGTVYVGILCVCDFTPQAGLVLSVVLCVHVCAKVWVCICVCVCARARMLCVCGCHAAGSGGVRVSVCSALCACMC